MPKSTVQLDQTWITERKPPSKVQLLPQDTAIKGRDGRSFKNDNPAIIVQHFKQDKKDIVIDIEHSSLLQAKNGQPAPAAGWITALEWQPEAGLFGDVRWNTLGSFAVGASEYRYLSPVLLVDENEQVIGIDSVALTNRPNLKLSSLNTMQKPTLKVAKAEPKAEPKTAPKAEFKTLQKPNIADVLKLDALKLDAAARTAITTVETTAGATTQPVPPKDMADKDTAGVANSLATVGPVGSEEISESEIEFAKQVVSQGINQGKIVPAVRSHYLGMCQHSGDALRLAQMVAELPTLYLHQSLDFKTDAKTETPQQPELSEIEQSVAEALGLKTEEFHQTKTNL